MISKTAIHSGVQLKGSLKVSLRDEPNVYSCGIYKASLQALRNQRNV